MRWFLKVALLAVAVLPWQPLGAQGGSDIWIVRLEASGRTITAGQPRKLTHRAGYDNQPSIKHHPSSVLLNLIESCVPMDAGSA